MYHTAYQIAVLLSTPISSLVKMVKFQSVHLKNILFSEGSLVMFPALFSFSLSLPLFLIIHFMLNVDVYFLGQCKVPKRCATGTLFKLN